MNYAGDENHPIDLFYALGWSRIGGGDTVLLAPGVYNGDFVSTISGAIDHPIVIKPKSGRVIINGSLTITGSYTHWYGIEITYQNWTGRDEVPNGTYPSHGCDVRGVGNRIIGCIIHDTSGNNSWQTNVNGGYYDCLIYNCGWLSPDRGHGHAIYTQNELETQEHNNNILWGQYSYGLHAYTEGGKVDNLSLTRNICYRNAGRQLALGGLGGALANNCTVDGNVILEGDGYLKGTGITLTNNFAPGGFTIEPTSIDVTQSGNTFTAPDAAVTTFVFPRTYYPGWAHISIYNRDSAESVQVDLTPVAGLDVGDTYILRNAQDYFTDIVTGVVPADKIIAIDMRAISHTVAQRIGSDSIAATSFPVFGAFVIEKV